MLGSLLSKNINQLSSQANLNIKTDDADTNQSNTLAQPPSASHSQPRQYVRLDAEHISLTQLTGHNDEKVNGLLQVVCDALTQGGTVSPMSSEGALGCQYIIKDTDDKPIAVFKPRDEEPYAPNNYKTKTGSNRQFGDLGEKPGIRVGYAVYREVAAYIMDHGNFAGVPVTALVELGHSSFVNGTTESTVPGRDSSKANNLKAQYGLQRKNSQFVLCHKLGSLQAFVENHGLAEDFGPNKFSSQTVRRIALLDIRILNLDRHGGNLLIQKKPGSSDQFNLVPIDHGYTLPEQLSEPYLEWTTWPAAQSVLSAEEVEYIQRLDPASDAAILAQQLPELGYAAIRGMVAASQLLKAVAHKKTLEDIAGLLEFKMNDDGEEEASVFATALMRSRNAVEHQRASLSPTERPVSFDSLRKRGVLNSFTQPELGSAFGANATGLASQQLQQSVSYVPQLNNIDDATLSTWDTATIGQKYIPIGDSKNVPQRTGLSSSMSAILSDYKHVGHGEIVSQFGGSRQLLQSTQSGFCVDQMCTVSNQNDDVIVNQSLLHIQSCINPDTVMASINQVLQQCIPITDTTCLPATSRSMEYNRPAVVNTSYFYGFPQSCKTVDVNPMDLRGGSQDTRIEEPSSCNSLNRQSLQRNGVEGYQSDLMFGFDSIDQADESAYEQSGIDPVYRVEQQMYQSWPATSCYGYNEGTKSKVYELSSELKPSDEVPNGVGTLAQEVNKMPQTSNACCPEVKEITNGASGIDREDSVQRKEEQSMKIEPDVLQRQPSYMPSQSTTDSEPKSIADQLIDGINDLQLDELHDIPSSCMNQAPTTSRSVMQWLLQLCSRSDYGYVVAMPQKTNQQQTLVSRLLQIEEGKASTPPQSTNDQVKTEQLDDSGCGSTTCQPSEVWEPDDVISIESVQSECNINAGASSGAQLYGIPSQEARMQIEQILRNIIYPIGSHDNPQPALPQPTHDTPSHVVEVLNKSSQISPPSSPPNESALANEPPSTPTTAHNSALIPSPKISNYKQSSRGATRGTILKFLQGVRNVALIALLQINREPTAPPSEFVVVLSRPQSPSTFLPLPPPPFRPSDSQLITQPSTCAQQLVPSHGMSSSTLRRCKSMHDLRESSRARYAPEATLYSTRWQPNLMQMRMGLQRGLVDGPGSKQSKDEIENEEALKHRYSKRIRAPGKVYDEVVYDVLSDVDDNTWNLVADKAISELGNGLSSSGSQTLSQQTGMSDTLRTESVNTDSYRI